MIRAFLAMLALASCGAAVPRQSSDAFDAKARALDGDTVAVDFRLLGVDAFERRQMCERRDGCWPCGKAAQDVAARLLQSGTAEIRLTDTSSYGRPVATVTVDGNDLGQKMIEAGLAVPELQFLRQDAVRASRYQNTFSNARARRAGAFAGRWIEPAKWRRGARLTCERSRFTW